MSSDQSARPKKVITAEHRAALIAGLRSAKGKRLRARVSHQSKANAFEAYKNVNDEINIQLQAVKDDVITMHKIMVQIDRAIIGEHWGDVSSAAAALHAFALNISRRVETCSAQATAANRIFAFLKASDDA